MHLFMQDHRNNGVRQRKIYALYEIIYTCIDFGAALTFIIGSFMFLSSRWEYTGTWFFIVGSFMFAAKPATRLIREVHLARMGNVEELASRIQH